MHDKSYHKNKSTIEKHLALKMTMWKHTAVKFNGSIGFQQIELVLVCKEKH